MSDEQQPDGAQPASEDKPSQPATKPFCGVVMPISDLDGCTESHWREVRQILYETIESTGYKPNLVSESESIGVILKDIITNIYTYPLIIADVSGKNSNVYFELGMRLTFDRAAVVIKDDKTDYSFDTSPIRHLTYPRDLNYWGVRKFKGELKAKIEGTMEESKKEGFSMFLKHFGQFVVPQLSTQSVSAEQYFIEELKSIKNMLSGFQHAMLHEGESVRELVDITKEFLSNIVIDFSLCATRSDRRELLLGALEGHLQKRGIYYSESSLTKALDFALVLRPFYDSNGNKF